MDLNNNTSQIQEQISAFMDGECQSHETSVALASLRQEAYQKDWEIYHQIGDILKSNEMGIRVSEDFNSRLNARLRSTEPDPHKISQFLPKHQHLRIVYALAAMLTLFAILIPRFAGNDGAEVAAPYLTAQFTSTNFPSHSDATLIAAGQKDVSTRSDSEPDMLRDPLIDSYLAAHQRYSSSMVSAVEYETGPIILETGKR